MFHMLFNLEFMHRITPGVVLFDAIEQMVTESSTSWDPLLVVMNSFLFIALIIAYQCAPLEGDKNSFAAYNFAVRDVCPMWFYEEKGEKFEQDQPWGPDPDVYLSRINPIVNGVSGMDLGRADNHCNIMDAPNDSSAIGRLDYIPDEATTIQEENFTWGIYKTGATIVRKEEETELTLKERDGKDFEPSVKKQLLQQTDFECQHDGCDQHARINACDEYMMYTRLSERGVKCPEPSAALYPQASPVKNKLPREQAHKA